MAFDNPIKLAAYITFFVYLIYIGYQLSVMYKKGFDAPDTSNESLTFKTAFWNIILLYLIIFGFGVATLIGSSKIGPFQIMLIISACTYLAFIGYELSLMYKRGREPTEDSVTYMTAFWNTILLVTMVVVFIGFMKRSEHSKSKNNPLNIMVYVTFVAYLAYVGYELYEMYNIGFGDDKTISSLLSFKTAFYNSIFLFCLFMLFLLYMKNVAGSALARILSIKPVFWTVIIIILGYLGFLIYKLIMIYKSGFNVTPNNEGEYDIGDTEKSAMKFAFINTVILYGLIFVLMGIIILSTWKKKSAGEKEYLEIVDLATKEQTQELTDSNRQKISEKKKTLKEEISRKIEEDKQKKASVDKSKVVSGTKASKSSGFPKNQTVSSEEVVMGDIE